MDFKKTPDSFFVEEVMGIKLDGGHYFYYMLKKHGVDSASAIKALEAENRARIYFSGLKDAQATTVQFICSNKELSKSTDPRIGLSFLGKSSEKIFVGMHSHNLFRVVFGGAAEKDRVFLRTGLRKTAFPNYFDDQRFNEKTTRLADALCSGNFENICRIALTDAAEFESEKSKEIKGIIQKNWGDWTGLCANEKIPESKKQVFSFLSKKQDFRSAIKLLEPKTIALAAKAAQAFEFNRQLAGLILEQKNRSQKSIEIAGQNFPILFSPKGIKRSIRVLPAFPFKRNLDRKTFFFAEKPKISFSGDECTLQFILKKGCYATIAVKSILAYCKYSKP